MRNLVFLPYAKVKSFEMTRKKNEKAVPNVHVFHKNNLSLIFFFRSDKILLDTSYFVVNPESVLI